jgi:hypothetical protein
MICSSLVTIVVSTINNSYSKTREIKEVRLAHFSVKEYLVSDHIRTRPALQYNIAKCAHDYIAQTCLTYLLYFRGPSLLTLDNIDEFPLVRYAAKYWTQHA